MSSGPGTRTSPRRRLLYGGVTLLLVFALFEGGTRIYYRARTGSWAIPDKYTAPENLRYVPDAHMGHVHAPGASYRINHKQISINSRGFRGPEVEVPKPAGRLRIACVGGSTTFDTRVSSDAHAWPAQLAERLREEHPELDFEVVNCGVPGYTTAETLINVALRVVEIEPDLVVVYHTWNDLKPAQEPGFRGDYSHWRKPGYKASVDWLQRLGRHSVVYLKLARRLRKSREHGARDAVVAASRRDAILDAEAEAAFRRNLESILALCRGHGIETALCTFATRQSQFDEPGEDFESFYTPNFTAVELQRSFRRYADLVRETAADGGAWLVDAQRLMPGGETFADPVHFSDEGSRAMADVVYRELDRQGAWSALGRRLE